MKGNHRCRGATKIAGRKFWIFVFQTKKVREFVKLKKIFTYTYIINPIQNDII